jgi:hypothetical protein
MKSVKNINFKLTRVEIIIFTLAIVILGTGGTYLFTHLKTSYASAYTYTYLGVSVWNPGLTKSYENSDFYSYACKNPSSTATTADVAVAMVASSYESYIESGSYVPSATVEINGSKIYNLGSSWNFNGVFATGTSVNHAGAWLRAINTLVNLPVSDMISMGPLANSDWPTVQTKQVSIDSLSNCQGTTGSVTASPPIVSTPASPPPTTTSGSKTSVSTTTTSTTASSSSTSSKTAPTASSKTSITSPTTSLNILSPSTVNKESAKISTSTVSPSQEIANIQSPVIGAFPSETFLDQSDWFWPLIPNGYSRFDAAVSPIIAGASDGYLFGNRFYFNDASNSYSGYVGLDTIGQNPTGRVAVFTISGAVGSSGPGVNTNGTSSGISYYTSTIKYPWVENLSYDLRVSITSQSGTTDTWTASVTNYYNGTTTIIGSIQTPVKFGLFYNQSETFTERYSGVDSSCNGIDRAEVEYSNISGDGSVSPTTHLSTTPVQTFCSSNYETEDMPGQVIQIVW